MLNVDVQIVEENVEPMGPDAVIESVSIHNVVVAFNSEIAPGEGGHGLFIDISGDIDLSGIISIGNPNGDFLGGGLPRS